jgi:hypothetical protein
MTTARIGSIVERAQEQLAYTESPPFLVYTKPGKPNDSVVKPTDAETSQVRA